MEHKIKNITASIHQRLLNKAKETSRPFNFKMTNSRMKDFYDIWKLSRSFDFKGELLARAIDETLKNRQYTLDKPVLDFLESFASEAQKISQWQSFLKKTKINDAPDSFADVVYAIKVFIQPIVDALADSVEFKSICLHLDPGLIEIETRIDRARRHNYLKLQFFPITNISRTE